MAILECDCAEPQIRNMMHLGEPFKADQLVVTAALEEFTNKTRKVLLLVLNPSIARLSKHKQCKFKYSPALEQPVKCFQVPAHGTVAFQNCSIEVRLLQEKEKKLGFGR